MAPNVKVAPGIPDFTHYVSLTNRANKTMGFILCDDRGEIVKPSDAFHKIPVDRTALKTSSGNSSYQDFEYPYSPIVQLDWSGGRGQLDFESDSTMYYDSFRLRTGRPGRAFLGPQEQYTKGYRSQDYSVPGNVTFQRLLDRPFVAKRFQASAAYTLAMVWNLLRVRGTPNPLTITLYQDSAAQISTEITHITVPASRMADTLSEWIDELMGASLTASSYYWIGLSTNANDSDDNHWEVAVKATPGSTYDSGVGGVWGNWSAAGYDLYFRLSDALLEKTGIFYEYMEQQYVVLSGVSGAPQIFMQGDRGAADPNTGTLNKLIDATKNWPTNANVGGILLVTAGPGKDEPQPWRTVISNDQTSCTVDTPWLIEHTTLTEYVLLGVPYWREIGGDGSPAQHGIASPVTDVLVTTQGIVLYALGDSAGNIRRHREYNNAGVWMESTAAEWADDGTNKASFLTYKPQAQKIFRGQNGDANGDVSVSSADPVPWATASHTFSATPTKVGSKYRRITGLEVYPEDNGNEAAWVGKIDRPWIVPSSGNPYPMALKEMENVRSTKNFAAHLVENVYLYFSLGNGVERYYIGNLDDIGPNLGEGLPRGRQGAVVTMSGYPGKFFAAVDGGATGYSAIFDRDNDGWHERYRAPLGQRIKAMAHQVIPGPAPDRLWIYVGNDLIWLPFPSDTTNELEDSNYLFTHEGALIFSRMHAGMFDVQKIIRLLKFWTSNLVSGVCWIEVDYRLNEDTAWTALDLAVQESPIQIIDLKDIFGIAAKRIQLRLRFYTTDASKTPVLLVAILDAVIRAKIKYMYPLQFRIEDGAQTLNGHGPDDYQIGIQKIAELEKWADESSDSMVRMNAISPLFDDVMLFLNAPETMQLQFKSDRAEPGLKNVYVVKTSAQEA